MSDERVKEKVLERGGGRILCLDINFKEGRGGVQELEEAKKHGVKIPRKKCLTPLLFSE